MDHGHLLDAHDPNMDSPFEGSAFASHSDHEFGQMEHDVLANDVDFDFVHDAMSDGGMPEYPFLHHIAAMDLSPLATNHGMADVDPSRVWQVTDLSPEEGDNQPQFAAAQPQSALDEIVRRRGDHVLSLFGQITPPDDTASNVFMPPPEGAWKPSNVPQEPEAKKRTDRARNAANTRHSKPKKGAKSTAQDQASDDGESGGGQQDSHSQSRERNRLAAAKCRMKKKAQHENIQQESREQSAINAELQRQVRELRDQRAGLQSHLLEHRQGKCDCTAIHTYNMQQAQHIMIGIGNAAGHLFSTTSPESVQSPGSEASGVGAKPGSDSNMSSTAASRHPSLNGPQNPAWNS